MICRAFLALVPLILVDLKISHRDCKYTLYTSGATSLVFGGMLPRTKLPQTKRMLHLVVLFAQTAIDQHNLALCDKSKPETEEICTLFSNAALVVSLSIAQ